MKRFTLLIVALVATGAYAQSTQTPAPTATTDPTQIGGPDPLRIGDDHANPKLADVAITKFEDDGFWRGEMSRDDGFITLRRISSKGPLLKKPVSGDVNAKVTDTEADEYVLGAKVEHLHRAVTSFSVVPLRPISMPGIVKTISVWVAGRNVNHQLFAIVNDQFGNTAKIFLGNLAFTGWRQLTGAVPPSIKQLNPRFESRTGLTFQSFLVETDPNETYGQYYIYFDGLTTMTDMYIESQRDADDVNDSAW